MFDPGSVNIPVKFRTHPLFSQRIFDEPGCGKGFTMQGKPAEAVWRSLDPKI